MSPTQEYVLQLASPRATLESVGGKGASLARLTTAGLPVPDGFHVTTEAYQRFVADNELSPAIDRILSDTCFVETASLESASAAIARLFDGGEMATAVSESIVSAYAALAGGEAVVAVRSSGTAEDLPELSFAGQQETYLNVRGNAAVLAAVKRCWASLWTARAIGYRAQHGVEQTIVSLAVVVQTLVPADAAGVLFTANPVSGARDQAMLTATWGLGEALVSGAVTPDTLIVDKASGRVVERKTADKAVTTVRTDAGTVEQATPEAKRRAAVLDDAQAAALVRLGVRIEALYGMPMDIEWAVAPDGDFAILQARPITALPPAEIEWRLPNPKGMYARSSIIELLPEPLTPLFGSLGRDEINRAYVRLGQRLLKGVELPDPLLVLINDYAYYDVGFSPKQTLQVVIQMPRFGWFMLSTAEARWRDAARTYQAAVNRWREADLRQMSDTALLGGVRELLAAGLDYYIYTVQGGVLPAAYLSEATFTAFYDSVIRRPDDPPALAFVLGFDSLPIQAEKSLYELSQWCRSRPELASAVMHSSADELMASHDGADWAEFRQRFAAHQARFGHAIYDLDFAKATPADDPRPVLETLKQLIGGHGRDPHQRQAEAVQRREAATHRIGRRLRGWKRVWFFRLLNWAQRYAPLREDGLGDTGLAWPVLRRMLLEVGGRLVSAGAIATPEDVFWLTEAEIRMGVGDFSGGVAERRSLFEVERRHTPPPALPARPRFAGVDFSRWLPARAEDQSGPAIKGLGASPGKVTATARVLRGPEDFGQMQPGDVLVAAITTPAWTPLFALAAAVVTDVGGPLSHSSIVAREYGVPAVLGTGVATRRIHSGDVITVDGSAGTVTLSA